MCGFWFGHELLDKMLGFVISTFAYVLIANIPLFVDEVARGPITLLVGAPSSAFVVKGDGIIDFKIDGGLQNVFDFFLVAELGVMNADDGEIVPFIFLIPFPDPGNHTLAVNSTERPKFEQDDFALHISQAQWAIGI